MNSKTPKRIPILTQNRKTSSPQPNAISPPPWRWQTLYSMVMCLLVNLIQTRHEIARRSRIQILIQKILHKRSNWQCSYRFINQRGNQRGNRRCNPACLPGIFSQITNGKKLFSQNRKPCRKNGFHSVNEKRWRISGNGNTCSRAHWKIKAVF